MRRRSAIAALLLVPSSACVAHGTTVGDVLVDHPYAVLSARPEPSVAVHFRTLKNRGDAPDRLLSAITPAARRARLQVRAGARTAEFRDTDGIDLSSGAELPFRHDGTMRILLEAPLRALRVGDRFPMQLHFLHAGKADVQVWVQKPRAAASDHVR
jgi:copper(I)-binding protein